MPAWYSPRHDCQHDVHPGMPTWHLSRLANTAFILACQNDSQACQYESHLNMPTTQACQQDTRLGMPTQHSPRYVNMTVTEVFLQNAYPGMPIRPTPRLLGSVPKSISRRQPVKKSVLARVWADSLVCVRQPGLHTRKVPTGQSAFLLSMTLSE